MSDDDEQDPTYLAILCREEDPEMTNQGNVCGSGRVVAQWLRESR